MNSRDVDKELCVKTGYKSNQKIDLYFEKYKPVSLKLLRDGIYFKEYLLLHLEILRRGFK